MEFTVKVEDGNVYINGELVDEYCLYETSIGRAITNWLKEKESEVESYEDI